MDTGSDEEGPPELVESGSHVPPTSGPHDIGKKVPITIVTGVQSSLRISLQLLIPFNCRLPRRRQIPPPQLHSFRPTRQEDRSHPERLVLSHLPFSPSSPTTGFMLTFSRWQNLAIPLTLKNKSPSHKITPPSRNGSPLPMVAYAAPSKTPVSMLSNSSWTAEARLTTYSSRQLGWQIRATSRPYFGSMTD